MKGRQKMKNAKKVLLLVLCAVLLVGASVAGTVAYLTATDSVENTFTVGNNLMLFAYLFLRVFQ